MSLKAWAYQVLSFDVDSIFINTVFNKPPAVIIRTDLSPPRKNMKNSRTAGSPNVSSQQSLQYSTEKGASRVSKDELLISQKGQEKPKEKKLEWGKGLAQKRDAEARQWELELENDKPFARTRDDPELEQMLKERVRWGDPMADLVKKRSEPDLLDLGDSRKMKESGFIIPQDFPSHSWTRREVVAQQNRYGIRPGRHWDGVDRSRIILH
ncbi:hypothetical protein L1049_016638 [Liquidambar formosana]|uniref:BUD13 homolog n=1 Tax=Liquidambar formosana TaxID=63359 RepID=A0AAP0X0Q9_LIQFO